tara:strand:+ start:286 stop:618 length:333 start_codon:yes stop_codon:yes gene_type:complete
MKNQKTKHPVTTPFRYPFLDRRFLGTKKFEPSAIIVGSVSPISKDEKEGMCKLEISFDGKKVFRFQLDLTTAENRGEAIEVLKNIEQVAFGMLTNIEDQCSFQKLIITKE